MQNKPVQLFLWRDDIKAGFIPKFEDFMDLEDFIGKAGKHELPKNKTDEKRYKPNA